jgi:hypothetical protein
LRSNHNTDLSGAKAGVTGIATRSQFEAATCSLGGHGTLASTSYNAMYSKKASAMYLSHKVFSSTGDGIALTEAYLYETVSGTTRVLRTIWTNISASNKTLNCYGELAVLF